jgi:Domain of unknown function (DUF4283)
VARALPKQKYLIEPPNEDWRHSILEKGEVILGDVQFVVEPYNFKKFDGGMDPVILWVNITELPPHLWKEKVFNRIALELGGYFLEADPRSWKHIDFTIMRIRVVVKSKEVVLPYRNMAFIDDDGSHRFYDLLFKVEDELAFQRTKQYWQSKTTTPVSQMSVSKSVDTIITEPIS